MDSSTILTAEQCPSTHAEIQAMSEVPYQCAIGSLMYAAMSMRPDIVFAVATLSQFMRNPGKPHWEAAKRVLRHLKGTSEFELTLGLTGGGLEAFVNADWASQSHRHSISSYVVMLNGGPVAWSARKQPLIALSTAEAEYIALTSVAREVLYLQYLTEELYKAPLLPTSIFCDNQAAIALAANRKFQSRTKHIAIRYHFICAHVKDGTFALFYCLTDHNIADTFTKTLPQPYFQNLRGQMSLACA